MPAELSPGSSAKKQNQRRFEKVCDVLSDLNARLETRGGDPERHLSKDQIIEVVHETLQTASTASDEKKIQALKNGLAYAFLSHDSFDRKQLFLQILRGCTSIELLLLPVLYSAVDPYVVREGSPPTTPPFFATNKRTRIVLFALNLDLLPSDSLSSVVVYAEDGAFPSPLLS